MNIAEFARLRGAVGTLCGARGVQSAVIGNGCKRRSTVRAEQKIHLPTTREAVLQACLQGVILGGAERAVEFRGRGSAGLAIQNLACGARPDWRPVRIELVELIRCSRGHVTRRSNPTSEPLFSREIPGLNVTADEVVVVQSDDAQI